MANTGGRPSRLDLARTRLAYDALARLRPSLLDSKPGSTLAMQQTDGISDHLHAHPPPGPRHPERKPFKSCTIWQWCVKERAGKSSKSLQDQRHGDLELVRQWAKGLQGLNAIQNESMVREYGLDHNEASKRGLPGRRAVGREMSEDEEEEEGPVKGKRVVCPTLCT